MADLALIFAQTLPALPIAWQCLCKVEGFALFLNKEEGPNSIVLQEDCDTFSSVYIGQASHFAQIPLLQNRSHKIPPTWPKYGVDTARQWQGNVAGFVVDKARAQACVFRDRMGIIPIVGANKPDLGIITTSPTLYHSFCKGLSLNLDSAAQFLRINHDESQDDWYQGSFRLLPATCSLVTPNSRTVHRYWSLQDFEPLRVDFETATELIRSAFDTAMRRASQIPNPCLSLSGGLDSGAIAGWFCKNRAHQLPAAYSLVSSTHPESDESRILDLWQAHSALRVQRIDMAQISESTSALGLWGPVSAPGMHITLALFEHIARCQAQCTILTGFGGNFIVHARKENVLRELFAHRQFAQILAELRCLPLAQKRALLHRVALNRGPAAISRKLQELKRDLLAVLKPCTTLSCPELWLNRAFRSKHAPILGDPLYGMNQLQERAAILRTREWDYNMRMLDAVCRQSTARYYDPLLDPDLFLLCARIPAPHWSQQRNERKAWKAALSPLIAPAILAHPKVQSFDAHAYPSADFDPQTLSCGAPELAQILDFRELSRKLHQFQNCSLGAQAANPLYLWRAMSLLKAFG